LARLVGKPEAEDLTQDVFVKVQRGLPRFRGDASLSTWIYRIATNAAVDRMRRTSTRRNAELRLPVNDRAAVVLSDVEEFTDQEIAAILGLSVTCVSTNGQPQAALCARST
jgi:DNA-directed RNA polymerase specialized sigma24 family protein